MTRRPTPELPAVALAAAMLTCCALPLLLSAGALAFLGAALRSGYLLLAGLFVLVGTIGYTWRRYRQRQIPCHPRVTARTDTTRDKELR